MGENVNFSDCVRHLYLPKLNQVKKTLSYGIREWLNRDKHYIVTETGNNYIKIIYYDESELLGALAYDISRLSCAFLETITNIKESTINDKFLAWILIQYYYSAFYSAHSIIKILGFGLVQLDNIIINKLCNIASVGGIAWQLKAKPGIYCIHFDNQNQEIILYNIRRYDDSHRGLWKRFFDVINIITGEYITSNTYEKDCIRLRNSNEAYPLSLFNKIEHQDALESIQRLDELKYNLNTNGDSNWLSGIRNKVNYNHGMGSWFPYQDGFASYKKVVKLKSVCFDNFLSDSFCTKIDDHLIKYIKTCQLINSLNFDILCDLKNRNPDGKSFLQEHVFRFYSEYCDKKD